MVNKKRLIQLTILAVAVIGLLAAAWPVYAADVGNALYIADVVATNSGEEAATNVAVAVDVNTQALINGKYATEDLLNTAIQTPGGSDVPYMPGVGSNPWIYWLPSVEAYESKPYLFYCGGPAMQDGFVYFPGEGGMTTDDSASLEFGDTFRIEQRGYIDTSAGGDLAYKEGAFITYESDSEEISAAIADFASEYSSTSDGYIYSQDPSYPTAQSAASGTIDDSSTTLSIGQLKTGTYPTIVSSNNSYNNESTSHTVDLPPDIVAGNLLLIVWCSSDHYAGFPNVPSGWTQLFIQTYDSYLCLAVFYKVADGGEGSSVTITTSYYTMSVHLTYQITGYGGMPECGTAVTGASQYPDPPSLSPSWGSAAVRWLAIEGNYAGAGSANPPDYPTSYPSGYTDGEYERYNAGYAPNVGVAWREYTGSSQNPGTFTLSASDTWITNTVAIPVGLEVDRGFLFFDTSSLPDDVDLAGATLNLYGSADNSDTDFALTITNGQPTYPIVEAVNGGNNASDDTNHTVNLPTGIEADDLLLVFFTADGYPTITFPGGWTELFQTTNGTSVAFGAWYRVADGGEGSTIVVTTSSSEMSAHTSYRITGYDGAPEAGTAATGSSTSPDPPSLSPSWEVEDTRWFAACGYNDGSITVTEYPDSYTDGRNDCSSSSDGVGVGTAGLKLAEASENPGAFTLSSSTAWIANTVAVCGSSPEGRQTYPTDPLDSGDFDKTHYSGIYSGNGGELSTSGFTTSGYNAIPLSDLGLEWINPEGTTKFCIMSSRDIAENTPTGAEYVVVYTSEESGTDKDPYLEIIYWDPAVTAEGITSGVRRIVVEADGTDLSLQVYDEDDVLIDSDTTALGGASVPDNDNDWNLVTNGSMLYMEYHKIWVDGTLKQHIVYERDTTFQDQTVYDNDATPTFITSTTDPDVEATFENFRPIDEMEYTGGLGDGGTGMLTDIPEEPPELYGEEGEGLSHIPGAEVVEVMLEEGNIPSDFFWIWFCYIVAAGGVLLGYRFIRSSLLFPVIIGFVVILGFSLASGGDPVPLWTLFPYGTISAGFIVSERVFGW